MLRVESLSVRYGAVTAVRSISFAIAAGDRAVLVGPNGAGKTSTLAAIAGIVAHDGAVSVAGADVSSRNAERRATAGLAFVPDGRRLFGRLSVEQNLRVGAVRLARAQARVAVAAAFERFPLLAARRAQRADTLSGGEGQLLMIARALVASPAVLLVDEPFQGLSADAADLVTVTLRAAAAAGAAVLVASPEPIDGFDPIPIHAGSIEAVRA